MTRTRGIMVGMAALLLIAQAIPLPPAENPPVGAEVPAPAEVMSVLRTSCYDCHSNETVWPWYGHVIPSKWFVRQHIVEGRGKLNFSTWGALPPNRAVRKLDEVVEFVSEGKMPLPSYIWLHKGTELTEDQSQMIISWAEGLKAEIEAQIEAEIGEPEAEAPAGEAARGDASTGL